MKSILLHICCAPCLLHPLDVLHTKYRVNGFFYNPNIRPADEYEMRKNELQNYSRQIDFTVKFENYDPDRWTKLIKGHENDNEGGDRCKICYTTRLKKCAIYAKQNRFDCFSTVLSVSPHKNSVEINTIGRQIGESLGILFVEADFKKKDGFKKGVKKSKMYGLRRQNYCGCSYSKPSWRSSTPE